MGKPKPTPDSQWDDIPGFDRKPEKFIPLAADAWLRDHNIREIAAKRGQQNQPATAQQDNQMTCTKRSGHTMCVTIRGRDRGKLK